jgi:hypothetical protein
MSKSERAERDFPDGQQAGAKGAVVEVALSGWGALAGVVILGGSAWLHAQPFWEIFLAEIGSVLLAASLLHLGYEHILRSHHLADVIKALGQVLLETWQGYSSLTALGIREGYDCIPAEKLGELIAEAKTVRIMKTWHPREGPLESGLKTALSRPDGPATVDFFLCDPNSTILRQRCEGAGEGAGEGKYLNNRLVAKLIDWTGHEEGCPASITFFDAWPGAPVIQCDEELFVGFFLRGLSSPATPWLKVDPRSEFGVALQKQFELSEAEVTIRLDTKDKLEAWRKNPKAPPKAPPKPAASVRDQDPHAKTDDVWGMTT